MARTRVVVPVVAALGVLVLLAGCGSDAGGRGVAGPSAPATATATVAPAMTATGGAGPAGTASAGPTVPQSLAFTARTLDGGDFDAAMLAGKPVVLWFWAPWCPECRAAGPQVAKTAAKYAGRVTVVGVAGLSDDVASMRQFVADTNTAGLIQLADGAGSVWKRFRVTRQDIYVLIAADGSVSYAGPLSAADLAARVGALVG